MIFFLFELTSNMTSKVTSKVTSSGTPFSLLLAGRKGRKASLGFAKQSKDRGHYRGDRRERERGQAKDAK